MLNSLWNMIYLFSSHGAPLAPHIYLPHSVAQPQSASSARTRPLNGNSGIEERALRDHVAAIPEKQSQCRCRPLHANISIVLA